MDKEKWIDIIYRIKGNPYVRVLYYPIHIIDKLFYNCFWRFCRYSKIIESYKDKYRGQKCYVVGNGPSLKKEDLNLIKGSVSIGTNRIYAMFNDTEWRPTFYFCSDAELLHADAKKMEKITENIIVLLSRTARKYHRSKDIIYFNDIKPFVIKRHKLPEPKFSREVNKYVFGHATIMYIVMQFVFYMGFKEIILIGIDNNYSKMVGNNGEVILGSTKKNHFPQMKELNTSALFNLKCANIDYERIKKEADNRGIKILNATRGGCLDVFDRVDLEKTVAGVHEELKTMRD